MAVALPAGVPPGSIRTGGNSNTDVYTDPQGNWYGVNRSTGQLEPGWTNGQPSGTEKGEGFSLTSAARGVTDDLGITTPDPSKSPEYQKLASAADAFGAFYQQDRANMADSRSMDVDTIARLRAAEEGKTPSAAENLMRTAIDQNNSQALGLAATLGGSNPGMALRAGMDAQAQGGSRSAAQIAAMRAQEMDAARQLLARQTGQGRATDTAAATSTGNTFSNIVGAPFAAQERADASNQALWGDVFKTSGTVLAASDERLKTGAAIDPAAADAFLSTLKPKTFEYKENGPNMPDGRRLGVMAQDLPQSSVATGPDGKKWISADVIGSVLAGLGRVNEKVEGKRGMKGTVAGSEDEHAAAMDYMTAPRRDARSAGRVAGGRAPEPRSMRMGDADLGMQEPVISRSAVHDYLAGLGIVSP